MNLSSVLSQARRPPPVKSVVFFRFLSSAECEELPCMAIAFRAGITEISILLHLFEKRSLMQRYKRARWRQILRRGPCHRRLIRSARELRHSRSRAARIFASVMLTIAWLVLPLLPGCGRRTPTAQPSSASEAIQSTPADSLSSNSSTTQPLAPLAAGRNIKFRGLDNDYHGTTRVLPNKTLIHQKESHD